MAIDVEKGTPGWYLKRLDAKLVQRRAVVDPLFARYEGNAPVPRSLKDAPEAAQQFFRTCRTTWAEMIVKAVKYPLRMQGCVTSATQGEEGDLAAFALVRSSGMKDEADDVHRLAAIAGNGYAIVSRYGEENEVRYTAEDPRQIVTIHDPVVQAKIVAAGKFFFHEEDQREYAYLYRPGRVYRAYRDRKTAPTGRTRFQPSRYEWDEAMGGADGVELAGASTLMPVFRYRNEEGVGEFERHVDLLDRLDHLTLQGMVIATVQAFKQRAIMVDPKDMPDEDEETGEPIDYSQDFISAPDAMWKLPATAKMWESGHVDLTPIWTGIEKAIQQLAAVTFTSLAMFSPDGQNQSAAGAGYAREGRTFKIEDRQDRFGTVHAAALAAMLQLAATTERPAPVDPSAVEVIWRPAERYSLQEKSDAGTKAKATGIPWATIMRDIWQYDPAAIRRMQSERMDDLLLAPELSTVDAELNLAPADGEQAETAGDIKARGDALGVLIRSGADPIEAAARVGLQGLTFPREPVSVRGLESD